MRRHPDISLRTPNPVGGRRAEVSTGMIEEWFQSFLAFLTSTGQNEILNSPQRIFNCDESGFPLSASSGAVLAQKGSKTVFQRVSENKEQITVLGCMSASGLYVPPLIIFSG